MAGKSTERKEWDFYDDILIELLADPTKSSKQMAEDLNITRQKLWREKKRMEEEKKVWGYTSVIDPSSFGWVDCVILLRLSTMDPESLRGIIDKVKTDDHAKYQVRVRDAYYLDGEFDALITFCAPDIIKARRYYESIRLRYERYLLDKPVMMEVNFALWRSGKLNPIDDLFSALMPGAGES